jgi:hypothetical protein
MSRILESVFVIGCAVVGFCLDANDGRLMQDAVKVSVQFVSMTENRIATHLARVPYQVLGSVRID